jgi:integrase
MNQRKAAYSRQGKIKAMLTLEDFEHINEGIKKKKYRCFVAVLYYSGVRVSELLRAAKEDFTFSKTSCSWNIGTRLKGGRETAPLILSLELPFMDEVERYIKTRRNGARPFDFDRHTAWVILKDSFGAYPHYFRLNRITSFLRAGFSLPEVMSWTGHKSVSSLDSYIGAVSVERLSESLLGEKGVVARDRRKKK